MNTEEKYARYVTTSFVKSVEPVVFARALGTTVWDVEGREYLDLFSGISVVNVGHANPRVVAAAQEQMHRYIHCASYVYYAPPVADFAERLATLTPGRLQKTFFANSGAEAIEGAMRLAKIVTGRTEIIALQQGFHGRTQGTLAVTGNMARKTRGGPFGGTAFAPAPYEYRCRYCQGNCTLACADVVEDAIRYQTSGSVAAFLAEPLMGEGGLIVPPEGYFARVKEILDLHGILFIDDEVQTGFGRTGYMFGIEHDGVEPDIMAMAKGIADGFPLGAFIAPAEMADSFAPGEHLSTFGGNPVCCAAGLATTDVLLEDDLPRRALELGAWALGVLREMAERQPLIGDVRGRGLMIGLELVRDRSSREPAAAEAAEVRRLCRQEGLLVGVGGQDGNVVRIQPPLVIESGDLGRGIEIIERALARVAVAV